MSKRKTIYDLELNENIVVNGHTVHRVPGGWVYTREEPQVNILSTCFVPYSNEFKEPIKLDTPKFKEEEVSHVINTIRDWIDYLKNKTKFKEITLEGVGTVSNEEALSHFEKALEILRTHTR